MCACVCVYVDIQTYICMNTYIHILPLVFAMLVHVKHQQNIMFFVTDAKKVVKKCDLCPHILKHHTAGL